LTTQHLIEVVNATRLCQGGAVASARDIRLQRELEELIPGLIRRRVPREVTRTVTQRSISAREISHFGETFADGSHGGTWDGIFGFTVTAARVEADAALDLHDKGMAVLRQLESSFSTLESKGQLSREVEDELKKLTGAALGSLQGLSNEHAKGLAVLVEAQHKASKEVAEQRKRREFVELSNEEIHAQVSAIGKYFGKLYGPPAPVRWIQRLRG
jgi:hypothetical protein